MTEETKALEQGFDLEGVFFRGHSVVLETRGMSVALVGADMDSLRWACKRLLPDLELDESGIQCVRIHKDH